MKLRELRGKLGSRPSVTIVSVGLFMWLLAGLASTVSRRLWPLSLALGIVGLFLVFMGPVLLCLDD